MFDHLHRLVVITGMIPYHEAPTTWSFLDYDTRRWIQFEGPTDLFGINNGDEDCDAVKASEALLTVIDYLDQNVTKVTFAADGRYSSLSTNPKDSLEQFVEYPILKKTVIDKLLHGVLIKDQWTEKDRFGPGIDLIKTERLLVFKYVLVRNSIFIQRLWTAAFIHQALSKHPNIVPFKNFVVTDSNSLDKLFIGYTTEYIPGGSLDVRPLEIFRLHWLYQLMDLVDDLNLKYGIIHHDIAPRNLLLQGDQILLFDFETVAFLGEKKPFIREYGDVIDLVFAIYEILTGDTQFGSEQQRGRKLELIEIPEWRLKQGIKLEHGITTHDIKKQLYNWARLRMSANPATSTTHGIRQLYNWARFMRGANPTTKFELRDKIFCPDMVTKRVITEMGPAFYVEDVPLGTRVNWKRQPTSHVLNNRSNSEL